MIPHLLTIHLFHAGYTWQASGNVSKQLKIRLYLLSSLNFQNWSRMAQKLEHFFVSYQNPVCLGEYGSFPHCLIPESSMYKSKWLNPFCKFSCITIISTMPLSLSNVIDAVSSPSSQHPSLREALEGKY